ncbi:MAG: hypothetical protein Q4G35_05220 [Propionibacteriaceae bacterium]|nr:hypothetical protein [Propionibacteriaceae bacterium]
MNLTPERIDEMIALAEDRASRTRVRRRMAAGALGLALTVGLAVGGWALLNPGATRPLEAAPILSPSPTVSETTTAVAPPTPAPTDEARYPTVWYPEPTVDGDWMSYTDDERELIRSSLAIILDGARLDDVWAVVSRTTYADGMKATSPDVWVLGIDDSPALLLRVGGPLSPFEAPGGRRRGPLTPPGSTVPDVATVGVWSLMSLEGKGLGGGTLFLPEGEALADSMPPINPQLEFDAAPVPVQELDLTPPTPPAPDPAAVESSEEMIAVFTDLLPARLQIVDATASEWGFTFTLANGSTQHTGSLNLWHLTPGAQTCDTADQRFEDHEGGVGCYDNGAWLWRRADNTALYLPIHPSGAFTQDEAAALLTDQAWIPFLERIGQEPPQ